MKGRKLDMFVNILALQSRLVWCLLTGWCFAAPALDWNNSPSFRSALLAVQPGSQRGFTSMPPSSTGVAFTNTLSGDLFLTNAVAHNGAGLALGDIDGDGWVDLYFCALEGPNRLYRNLGRWQFQELSPGPAACPDQLSTGAAFADVDGDRDLDLLVNGIAAGTRLFLNDGHGAWSEVIDSGLSRTNSATSLALADIDGDGDLDLYCTHYIDVMHLADPTIRFAVAKRGDKWEIIRVNGQSARSPRWRDRFEMLPDGSVRELPEVHGLYRNDGRGRFTAIQFERGVFLDENGAPIPPYRDWGLSVMFRDLNGDRAPDLYVCNDNASPDRFWINTGNGTFRAIEHWKVRHTSRSSMGLDFADVNRDGRDDLFVADMFARQHRKRMTQLVKEDPAPNTIEQIEARPRFNRNTFLLGRSDGSFAETAFQAGLTSSDWSWCAVFIDVDLDGFEDLLVSNGFSFDVMDQDSHDQLKGQRLTDSQRKRARQFHPMWPTPNASFHNRGDGTFEPAAWGFEVPGISNGMALADLDNDGDLDIVVNNLNAAASLFRNDSTAGRIAVRLKGTPPNTFGIGSRLKLIGHTVNQTQEIICGGRYMSCDQAMRVFASDPASTQPLQLDVIWRNGAKTTLTNVLANRIYEIEQPETIAPAPEPSPAKPAPFFTDATARLNHRHADDPFDDWAHQPLLPRRLSRLGPGLSWFDLNGDGWEDLIIPGGRGSRLAVLLNDAGNGFQASNEFPPNPGDQTTALGWHDGHGHRGVLTALSNYELAAIQPSQLIRFTLTESPASPHFTAAPPVPTGPTSPGPLTLGDVDGDGDLDLFLGGRFLPGGYPKPVSSSIWLNQNGELKPDPAWSRPFENIGMVSGALFCDLDEDGHPELALAVEWGPVRVFRNDHTHFEDRTVEWGLEPVSGWWTSIAAGDFDQDGRMDLAAGNWGRNSPYQLYQPSPIRIYFNEPHGNRPVELLEAWHQENAWWPVRERPWFERAWPDLLQLCPTHDAFGQTTVDALLARFIPNPKFRQANQFDSSIFLNRGSHFERRSLPPQTQISPVFAINVADFDGDGLDDLFLAQNFFGYASHISRDDSGTGLWLRATGHGNFLPVDTLTSGIRIDGEQRGAALADFNHDGRVDLAVAQNNAPIRLFVNKSAQRGLRVALHGPEANPDAIGSQIRLLYPDGNAGPCRAIQAGSGYWSQDAPAQVLGLSGIPKSLWIRWPVGKEQTVPINPGRYEIDVTCPK